MKKRLLSLALCLALCLGLLPPAAFATSRDEPYEDTRTEIWCVSKPDSIGRGYDGTTDGSTIPITLTFTDGTNPFELEEGTGFTAKKTFDSADAGNHTVTVEITLIGEAAAKYKLKAGEEKFEIGGYINKAYPKLTVSISKTTCAVGEKLLPLLSVEGAPEDAEVTYYYLAAELKNWAGSSDVEGGTSMPKIDENTAISEPGTYYVYAKTAETKNYEEERSTTVELTVSEAAAGAASVTKADGTDDGTFNSLPEALEAAHDGDTVTLLADHETDWDAVDDVENPDESTLAVVTKKLTLDLNGWTVDYLMVGDMTYDKETKTITATYPGNLTVVSNGGGTAGRIDALDFVKGTLDIQGGVIGTDPSSTEGDSGHLTCNGDSGSVTISGGVVYDPTIGEGASVTVSGGSGHAGTWYNDGTLNITGGEFGNVTFLNNGGTIAISGGTFQSISNSNASASAPLMPLLADGYAFYQGDEVQDGTKTTLENVKVLEHTDHSFLDGKCIACGAMTCEEGGEGGCIAHVTKEHYTWHLKTLDKISYHLSAAGEWSSNYETVNVEFLSDVATDTTFRIEQCLTHVTLDLNGHTISGELSGSPVAEINYLYGVHCVIIQNGTIENTAENGTALQLSSGATTLENVDVKGDLALAYTFANSVNYTPTFLGGGSFTRICPVANDAKGKWSKKLSEMLGTGCCFLDSAGSRIDAEQSFGIGDYSEIKELVNVRVKACDHKDDNGNYTLFEDATMRYGSPAKRCKVCGNLCPHDEITAGQNPTCVACGLPIVIKTTNLLNGKAIGPWYYTGLNDAMYEILHVNKGRRPTLELLADTKSNSSYEWMTNDYDGIFIDLAGHTLTLTGDQNKASYWVTIQNTSDTHAEVRGTVNVYHKDSKSKLVVLDTDNNLTIEEVKFVDDGTAELAGGSFGKITVPAGKPLASLLKSSYYFMDSTTGKPAALYDADGNALTELTNVTVTPCSHDGSEAVYDPADHVWKCPCGQKTFVASVTKGEATTLYTDLQEAFKAADGGTVKLMKNERDVTVYTDEPFTLDLNGCEIYSLTVHSKITIKDSAETKGKITEWLRVSSGMTIGDLLEEGYGFQYVSSGAWCSGAEQAVGSVSVQQAPIKSVTAKNPSVTVEYGKTSEVTLTATVVPTSEEDATVSCQWYTSGGTRPPIEGETSSTYQLPADLNAGTYTYILAATKAGYEKSCTFTVTVEKTDLSKAEITFPDGNEAVFNYLSATGVPKFIVTCNGKEVETDDLSITGDTFPGVGPCTLTVTAAENSNYTGSKSAEWTVRPLKITVSGGKVVKTYDGTTDLPANASITFASVDSIYTGVTFGLTKDMDYQLLNAHYDSAAAGEEKTVSFTIKLVENGYVFADGTTEKDFTLTGKINKADAPNMSAIRLEEHVFNELEKTYEIDLKTLLPERTLPCEYGDITYGTPSVTFTDNDYKGGDAAVIDGVLRLPIKAANTSKSEIGTVKVMVNPTNYESFELTLYIIAQDKLVLRLAEGSTISATEITYGDTLSKSTLTVNGKMMCPRTGNEIKGTFAWTDSTIKPNAGSHEAEWTFTPAEGYEEYATATGIVTVKVNRKDIAVAKVTLKRDSFEYDGTRKDPEVASVVLDGATLTPATDYGSYCDMASDVGTHRLTVSGNNNYTGAVTVKWSITPKTVTPTITVASCTYTGDALTPTVTLKDGETVIDPSEYSVTYSNNTNAGTATVTITDKPGGNYIVSGSTTFPIAKADATCTAPTANKLTYNGGEQALLSAGSTQAGKMVYSLTEAGEYNEVIPSATNADGYVVWYKVLGDDNHNDTAPASVNVTISPATVTVKASDKSAYVGSTAPDLSKPELDKDYTVSGLFGEDALKTAPRLSYPKTPDMSKVGEAEIKIDGAEIGSNYKLEYQTGKLKITTRPSSGGSGSTGTKTDTVKNPDGSTTKTETKSDGSKTETTTATTPGGSTGSTVTKTDAKGNSKTEASAKISDKDLKDAQEKGEAVSVPVKDVEAGKNSNSATEVKIDLPKNAGKTTVEIPVDNVTSGTVAVIVHPDGTEEIAKSSKPTKDGLQVEIDGSTTVKIIDNSKDFIDTRDHWSRDEVNFVAARELFNGVGNNLFGVSQPMTRGMVNTVLARLSGVDTNGGDTWYSIGTEWAKKNGISDGTNPTGNVTREQLATLLYRYAGSPDVSGTLSFADAASVSDYAKNALLWANQNGIVNGVGSNTIAPKANAERAQVAAMFARYLKNQ